MIIDLYLTIAALGLTLIIIGFWKDKPILYFVGFTVTFACGVIMMGDVIPSLWLGGIEYQTGLTITGSTVSYTYATFSNYVLGSLIALISLVQIFITMLNPKVKFT